MSERVANPKPGSNEAIAKGCCCPIFDNAHGADIFGLGQRWYINFGCPIHGRKERAQS